ncbi:actin-related protein T3 [Ornithorhynchus anatinus]|uniref:Actin related protein T3 n=1 Tax=Ornithorhynchus anatinus TaxID=9258 RepID=A0A6I8NK49_ORNAN|nr:actin-related protein T3 [Ornithorhynchus anatinus]
MGHLLPAVVIDSGSGFIKSGLAGIREPQFVYANVTGWGRGQMGAHGPRELYVGEEAQAQRGGLYVSYPVERGIVTSWEEMEAVWRNVYEKDLKVEASERPVLLTETALNPPAGRERATELFFESFEVPAFYVAIQAVLALFASGRTTGCVLDCGDGVTACVPVFECYCLPHAVLRLELAGRDLTDYLARLLTDSGVVLLKTEERRIVRDIKETGCYVALDLEEEAAKKSRYAYRLPDGKRVEVSDQLFRCPESLFSPSDLGVEAPGVDVQCFDSVMSCDTELRDRLFSNVILAGGSSLFPGLDRRLLKGMRRLVPADTALRVSAPPRREFAAWIGGSILASISAFQDTWITVREYREVGPNIVHQRCF